MKKWMWQTTPRFDILFQFFDLYVLSKYKIKLLKDQVAKSYKTFVIQKNYGGRVFLLPSQLK